MKDEVLYTNKYFDVIDREGMTGITTHKLNVVIMPYVTGEAGLPDKLGVLREMNPFREGGFSITLVTGTAEGDDPDILSTAQRELKEETGYDVTEPDRWTFLGFLTTSKMIEQEHPCFAVNVTGLDVPTKEDAEGDGTKKEEESEFMLIPVKEALESNDCFVPALFLKIFRYVFGFTMKSDDSKETPTTQNTPS
jgi:8-oxo-dGTP pyrophosphatase MutT (NUDIX family)